MDTIDRELVKIVHYCPHIQLLMHFPKCSAENSLKAGTTRLDNESPASESSSALDLSAAPS